MIIGGIFFGIGALSLLGATLTYFGPFPERWCDRFRSEDFISRRAGTVPIDVDRICTLLCLGGIGTICIILGFVFILV